MDILQEFLELTAYSVPSKHEKHIRECLRKKLTELGFETWVDNAFPETGSGNLYARLQGTLDLEPLMFVAHMDTVTPCENKNVIVEQNGLIHTDGKTVLGGDDVTGIVELLAALRKIQADRLTHRTIEVVFTASEEYFVQGAERLCYDTLTARKAFILDTDGEIGRAVVAAPTGIRIVSNVIGKAAHAALKPEDGINAIAIVSEAVSRMRLGRVDADTTANIGIIRGGNSGNIVPETCFVEGETRSLCHESALRQRDHMVKCLQDAAEMHGGICEVETTLVYNAWSIQKDSELRSLFETACRKNGIEPCFESACGGSDASMMSVHGIECLVVATGMHEIHSVREYTTVDEMERMANVIFHLIT